jgi:hypothetical protein
MGERKPFEFFLLRYVPDAAREEFVNIGLVMTESGGDGGGFAGVHFTQDWRRARCLNPDVDVEVLDALGREIQRRIANVQDRALMVHEMMDRYSNVIQISPVRQCLTEDPAKELKDLASTLVEMAWVPGAPAKEMPKRRTGRKWIRSEMTDAFETAGVLGFMGTNMPVSLYTNETDKFTFDFSYSFGMNGEITRVFHAVSLVDKGKDTEMFPFRVAKIAPKMAQLKGTQPTFTAVVEDQFDSGDAYVSSILAFMKDENIQVAALREMPAIAETARVELRA